MLLSSQHGVLSMGRKTPFTFWTKMEDRGACLT